MTDTGPDSVPAALREYFDRSHSALALASAGDDNPLLMVNHAFCELTGYSGADVVGRNCRMLQRDAPNNEARERLRDFLQRPRQTNVRTPIVNFRKDGSPFVNLLYMSKLRGQGGQVRYVFASQFDVSRSQPELLAEYDRELGKTLARLKPALEENGIVLEGSLMTIANTAALVAQAKMTLADLDLPPLA